MLTGKNIFWLNLDPLAMLDVAEHLGHITGPEYSRMVREVGSMRDNDAIAFIEKKLTERGVKFQVCNKY